MVFYKCECLICGKFYIGNTQNHVKKRMSGHYVETRNLVNNGTISDSFARNFASHLKCAKGSKYDQIRSNDVRKITKVSILWQGNPISCMKNFGKVNCKLCMMERLEILRAVRNDKLNNGEKLINSSHEIYGACRHKSKFHRYRIIYNSSTDEGL